MRLQIPAFLLVGLVSAVRQQEVQLFYKATVIYTREHYLSHSKFTSTTTRTENFKRSYDELAVEVEANFEGFGASGAAAFAMEQVSDSTISSERESSKTSKDDVKYHPDRMQVYRIVQKELRIDMHTVNTYEKTYVYDYDVSNSDPCANQPDCERYWREQAQHYLNANLLPPGENPVSANRFSTLGVTYTKHMEVHVNKNDHDWSDSLEFFERRGSTWAEALRNMMAALNDWNVGTDQIISIDAHNNGADTGGMFSVQFNTDLPFGKPASSIRWSENSITYSTGAWSTQYSQSVELIRRKAPCGRVISTTGSINTSGSQVFWTFYVEDGENAQCSTKITASHQIEVDFRVTGYDEIETYLKTYQMSNDFRDTASSLSTEASASGGFGDISAGARFALTRATQKTTSEYKHEDKENQIKKKFGPNSYQLWRTIKNTIRLNGQTFTNVEETLARSYAEGETPPSFEWCQGKANEELRSILFDERITDASTNTYDRVFDDNQKATVYTSIIHEKLDIPRRLTDNNIGWYEDRATKNEYWTEACENIKEKLIEKNIGTGQIVWIDSHNNGEGRHPIVSVIYNKNLPYGKSSKYLNFMILNRVSSWFAMQRDSNRFLGKVLGDHGNIPISISGSINEDNRSVFVTWYTEYQKTPSEIDWIEHYKKDGIPDV